MNGSPLTDFALVVFIIVVTIDAVSLVIDLAVRLDAGVEYTITRLARRHFWFGAALLAWQVLGAIALGVHLYGACK